MTLEPRVTILGAMIERFGLAQASAGAREVELVVARRRVRLRFAGDALLEQVAPALAHLVARGPDATRAPELTVHLWDTRSTDVDMIPAPWDVSLLGPGGAIPEATSQGLHAIYRLECDMLIVVDARAGQAIVWLDDARRYPRHERAAPLRSTLAAFFAPRGPVVAHAGAVGLGDRGVLLGGRGGSGKSTTALLCLAAGLDFAGDDYVMVEVGDDRPPWVHSLYATSKLVGRDTRRVPSLARAFDERDDSERAPGEKAMAFLHPHVADRLSAGFGLVALLLPTVTARAHTSLVPITPAQALRGLAPSTVFQQDAPAQPVLATLARLAARLPCHRLELGTELGHIPEVIADLITREAR